MISAFAALTVLFSSQQPAHSAGQTDAFIQQNQQHQSRPQNQVIFSRKSNNDGPSPGKPNGNGSDENDDDIPKYPKTESIEETQIHLSNIDEQIHKLEEVTDYDSEAEEDFDAEIEPQNIWRSIDSVREITAHDGVEAILTNKSANHLTSKHGHNVGIDDLLPPNPNQRSTKYRNTRTRISKENKERFADIVEEILKDPTTTVFRDVNMRGIKGNGYLTDKYGEYGFFVGIHGEGEFAGQIKKAQPVSAIQLEKLEQENKID